MKKTLLFGLLILSVNLHAKRYALIPQCPRYPEIYTNAIGEIIHDTVDKVFIKIKDGEKDNYYSVEKILIKEFANDEELDLYLKTYYAHMAEFYQMKITELKI